MVLGSANLGHGGVMSAMPSLMSRIHDCDESGKT